MHVEAPLLARLLTDTQAELVQTAAAAAMWQERCRVLEAQVEQLRALPAPPSDAPPDAPRRESDAARVEPVQEPARLGRRPWWRVW